MSSVYWFILLGIILAGIAVLAWQLLRAGRPLTEGNKDLQRAELSINSTDTSTSPTPGIEDNLPTIPNAPAPIGGNAPSITASTHDAEVEAMRTPPAAVAPVAEEPNLTETGPIPLPPSECPESSPVDQTAWEAENCTVGNVQDYVATTQVNVGDDGSNEQEKQGDTTLDDEIGPAEIEHAHERMRITKQSSSERCEYGICGTFDALTPWNVLDRPIVLELDGLAINTQIVLRNLNGKRWLRMDTSAGCEMHLHRQLAVALLMPSPARDETTLGRDMPVLRSELYVISKISLSDAHLEAGGTVRVVPDEIEVANLGSRDSFSCIRRFSDVRKVWGERNTFPPDVAQVLAEHERLLLRGGPFGESLEVTVSGIQQAIFARRGELGISIVAGDDPLQALLHLLSMRDGEAPAAPEQDAIQPEVTTEEVAAAREPGVEETLPFETPSVEENCEETAPPIQVPPAEPTLVEPIAPPDLEELEAAPPAPTQVHTPETGATSPPYEPIASQPKVKEPAERAEEPEATHPVDETECEEKTAPPSGKPPVPQSITRTQSPRPPRPGKPKGPPAPRRYQPPQRGRNVTRRSTSTGCENEDDALAPASEKPSPIALRLRNQRGGMVAVSLLARRREGMPANIDVTGAGAYALSLSALRDDWYQDVSPEDLGALLRTGAEWCADNGDARLRWSLAGRDLYVLGTSDEWSGYLSTSCLALGDEHAVLCVKEVVGQVENLLRQCCDAVPGRLTEDDGVPEGWVVLCPVTPAKPIPLGNAPDIYDALCPSPDIKIALRDGIRLNHAQWLAGHPPAVRLHGDAAWAGTFLIDGSPATLQADSSYTTPGWDSVGDHVVACGGQTKKYSIVDPADGWDAWVAYEFPSLATGICGALALTLQQERRSPIQVPTGNPILLGKRPGEIYRCPVRTDVGLPFCQAFPPFVPLWAVPANPMHANKSTARILVLPAGSGEGASQAGQSVGDVRQWCSVILDCSRKGLALEPAGLNATDAWRGCREVARNLWRASR